jgi:hypothetical protein
MSMTLTELIEAIKQEYDIELIVEALEISVDDLLDRFEDKLTDNIHKFEHLNEEYEPYD